MGSLTPGNIYEVTAYGSYVATGDIANNMKLIYNGGIIVTLPVQGGNNTLAVPYTVVIAYTTASIFLSSILAGAAGSIYIGSLVARRVG